MPVAIHDFISPGSQDRETSAMGRQPPEAAQPGAGRRGREPRPRGLSMPLRSEAESDRPDILVARDIAFMLGIAIFRADEGVAAEAELPARAQPVALVSVFDADDIVAGSELEMAELRKGGAPGAMETEPARQRKAHASAGIGLRPVFDDDVREGLDVVIRRHIGI